MWHIAVWADSQPGTRQTGDNLTTHEALQLVDTCLLIVVTPGDAVERRNLPDVVRQHLNFRPFERIKDWNDVALAFDCLGDFLFI